MSGDPPDPSSTPPTGPLTDIGADGRLHTISHYRIIEQLGAGGMGIVYRAIDELSGDKVALKVLRVDPHAPADSVERFRREAESAASLDHPHIVHVRDSGHHGDLHFFSMDLIEGVSLTRWARSTEPTVHQRVEIMLRIAEAVQHAHEQDIIHRDLKPDNIIVAQNAHPYVTDFGLARNILHSSSLTRSAQAIGTPAYMAPEQARGQHKLCDARSDIWAFGVMLYELLCGAQPFQGDTPLDVVAALVEREPAPMRIINHALPSALERVTMQCLRKDMAGRYPSMAAVAADLRRWLNGASVHARSYGPWQRTWPRLKSRMLPIVLGLLLVLSAALLVSWRWHHHQREWGRWTQVFHRDFTLPELDLSGLRFLNRDCVSQEQDWVRGRYGLTMERKEWCWIDAIRVPTDVRVVARVRSTGRADGTQICLNSRLPSDESEAIPHGWLPPGYACEFGGENGIIDMMGSREQAGRMDTSSAVPTRMQPDQEHELIFERDGDTCIIRCDGQVVLRELMPLPVSGIGCDKIGLRTDSFDMELLELSVYRLAPAESASPLLVGDAMIRLGHPEGALDEYRTLAAAYSDTGTAERATVKAFITALQLYGLDHPAVALIRQDLDHIQQDDLLQVALEAEARLNWREQRIDPALDLIDRVMALNPDTRIMARCLSDRRGFLDDQRRQRVLQILARSRSTTVVNISGMGVEDLQPLAGLPLHMLDCSENPIHDLAPLGAMPLRALISRRTEVRSLEPLRGLSLLRLELRYSPVESLDPLRGMKLYLLDIISSQVSDLSPLAGMPLRRLWADDCAIEDISPLAGAPLEELGLGANQVRDLEVLRGMPLQQLLVNSNHIDDLQPLVGMPLRILHAGNNTIRSLAPLERLPLESLIIGGNPISDFGGLFANPPKYLIIGDVGMDRSALLAAAEALDRSVHKGVAKGVDRLALALSGDDAAIWAQAVEHGSWRYLQLPFYCNWDRARELAPSLGAELVSITDQETMDILSEYCWSQAWLGGEATPDGLVWLDGSRPDYSGFKPGFSAKSRAPIYLSSSGRWGTGWRGQSCSLLLRRPLKEE